MWNPKQYNKFKAQRAQPFFDLMGLIQKRPFSNVLDLGCGTGELTKKLFEELKPAALTAIDSSSEMLKESEKFQARGLTFAQADISEYRLDKKYDVVFSNAALQWVPDHEALFPRILDWIFPGGQVAVQVPFNFDHPSHAIAHGVAERLFPGRFENGGTRRFLLTQERYAEILFKHGFHDQICRIEAYGHPMPSGSDVVEWTKGTLLTRYRAKLTDREFETFLATYAKELVSVIGSGPYFYVFKRLLIWGRRND